GFQNLKPILSSRKVFIINDARNLTGEAQNALLKSLEEPSGRSIFILIASDQADFFETIRSRCQKIKFSRLDFDDFKKIIESSGLPSERLKEFYFLFGGRPGPALKFAASEGQKNLDRLRSEFLKIFKKDLWERYRLSEDLVKDEKNFLQTLDFWRLLIRDLILAKIEAGDILINRSFKEVIAREAKNHEIEKLLRIAKIFGRLVLAAKTTNLNSRLALDWALTEI
ncbi:MAG: hypothetical protein Q8L57_02300, partial [bacterium]|nr:hypothetical protein [bacterium]